jgi:hypothetical protein
MLDAWHMTCQSVLTIEAPLSGKLSLSVIILYTRCSSVLCISHALSICLISQIEVEVSN